MQGGRGGSQQGVPPQPAATCSPRTFYKVCRDVVKLADVLGHSSIETTRIYLISTGAEHANILRKMHLVE